MIWGIAAGMLIQCLSDGKIDEQLLQEPEFLVYKLILEKGNYIQLFNCLKPDLFV